MTQRAAHLGFGIAFGVALALSGAADFDAMHDMLLLRDWHLFGLGAVTTVLAMAGLRALRTRSVSVLGCELRRPRRPFHSGVVPGAVAFGIGWSVSGSCPGTVLVQLGEGHFIALATLAGIVAGMALHRLINERVLRWSSTSCE